MANSAKIFFACNGQRIFANRQLTPVTDILHRYSSYLTSPETRPLEQYPEIKIEHNPPEWKYVERLLSPAVVPTPVVKTTYSSGWQPQKPGRTEQLTYFVARTKNHMVPVYLHTSFRGQRRITIVRRVQGDIWTLERELRTVVENERGRKCATRVNEMSGQIHIHGDYVDVVREYLKTNGL